MINENQPLPAEHFQRREAVKLLERVFNVAKDAYVEAIQNYGIDEENALRQIAHMDEPCRKMMWAHIQAVMSLDEEFAEEVRPVMTIISQVLGMD